MARQLAEGQVALALIGLGLVVFLGLLPVPWIDTAIAALLILAGLAVLLSRRSRGNRLLATGLLALGGVLILAGLLDSLRPFLGLLTVLVASILLVAGWLKRQGKW